MVTMAVFMPSGRTHAQPRSRRDGADDHHVVSKWRRLACISAQLFLYSREVARRETKPRPPSISIFILRCHFERLVIGSGGVNMP